MLKLLFIPLALTLALLLPNPLQAENSKPLKLGVMAPLSGDFAGYGEQVKNGIEIALHDLNEEGINTEIIYEDACLPKQAITAAKKLIAQDIKALIGSYCVVGLVSSAQLFSKAKIPAFHTSVVPDSLMDKGKFILSLNIAIRKEASELAEIAFNEFKARTASIVYLPGAWGIDYEKYFTEKFESLGGKVLTSDMTQPFQNDFKPEIMRIRKADPDMVFPVLISQGLGTFIKQLRMLGVKSRIVSTDETEEQSVLDIAAVQAEGLFFLIPEKGDSPVKTAFEERYLKSFKRVPSLISKIAYDSTIVAGKAFKACAADTDCAIEKIYSIRNHNGASGKFSIKDNSGAQKGFVRKSIKNGKFVILP